MLIVSHVTTTQSTTVPKQHSFKLATEASSEVASLT